ncbi:MAG: sugar kinase [Trebonia sp.]
MHQTGTSGPEFLAVGETMAMIAPAVGGRLTDAEAFILDAGGAESNVAAHVAALGRRAGWFSRLGDDALGRRVARQLTRRGVELAGLVFDGEHPTGLYVKDPGACVSYYRRGSAAANLTTSDAAAVPLDGVRVLHVSGITAAISATAAAFLDRLVGRARRSGIAVSFDVNYRAQLWTRAAAGTALDPLVRQADIVFVGRDEAERLWGTGDASSVHRRFPEPGELIVKDGEVGATVFAGDDRVFEPSLPVEVVDAIGAGDAFAGGYLAAYLVGATLGERLRAGHARAVLTLRTTGDFVRERWSDDQHGQLV